MYVYSLLGKTFNQPFSLVARKSRYNADIARVNLCRQHQREQKEGKRRGESVDPEDLKARVVCIRSFKVAGGREREADALIVFSHRAESI